MQYCHYLWDIILVTDDLYVGWSQYMPFHSPLATLLIVIVIGQTIFSDVPCNVVNVVTIFIGVSFFVVFSMLLALV